MPKHQQDQEAQGMMGVVSYTNFYGPDIAHDGDNPERGSYRKVLLGRCSDGL